MAAKLKLVKMRLDQKTQRLQRAHELSQEVTIDSNKLDEFKQRCVSLFEDYKNFQSELEKFFDAHSKAHPEDESIPETIQSMLDEYEKFYFPTIGVYSQLCSEKKVEATRPQVNVRLPKIDLKDFNGTLADWPLYYNTYLSLIHKNPSLDSIAKFHYLISSLSGPPLSIVTELEITSENYEIAWTSLVKRYQNKRLLASDILSKLLNFSPCKRESKDQLTHFLTVFEESIQSLKVLKISDLADFVLLFLSLRVLPENTRRTFERLHIDEDIPTLKQLTTFIREQSVIFEVAQINSVEQKLESQSMKHQFSSKTPKGALLVAPLTVQSCICCKEEHALNHCQVFRKKGTAERRLFAKERKLCFNCLRSDHMIKKCKSTGRCFHCSKAHHSLLHESDNNQSGTSKNRTENDSKSDVATNKTPSVSLTAMCEKPPSAVLLGTTTLHVKGANGRFYVVRGVIDSAASTSYISNACAKRIGLSYQKSNDPTFGIGDQVAVRIKGGTTCTIKPRNSNNPLFSTETLVIERITADLPHEPLPENVREHFPGLQWADPQFDTPGLVEFLIGADVFPFLFTGQKIEGAPGIPPALSTVFGWVLLGRINLTNSTNRVALLSPSTDALLRKFWEIEEIPKTPFNHPDDVICEEIFKKEHFRNPDGRYVVPIMLRKDAPILGESQNLTLQRLNGLDRKLSKDPQLSKDYTAFISEYEQLGHMTEVDKRHANQAAYYIPHHCVIKEDSASSRLRVVFDASQKTSSGFSLNNAVYSGPKLQNSIVDIMIKFRLHKIVFTCDISKMYRQILVRPEDRKFQHIFWKTGSETKEYELNTVTYGVSSAPYVALRTIKQLTIDEGTNYPLAARALCEDSYVDDIVTGANDVPKCIEKREQLSAILSRGKFRVHKWASNHPEVLSNIPAEHCVTSFTVTDENQSFQKILGVHWDAQSDSFFYYAKVLPHKITKRNILAQVARTYDPLGWISPIIFSAKVMLQKLWLEGVDWDSPVPKTIEHEWLLFCQELPSISKLKINRCVTLHNASSITLVGFSDASIKGFSACVYLRSESNSETKVSLLTSKTRVAPTKSISIPRLELCGAKLLSSLIETCKELLSTELKIDDVIAFTDSEVVLAWLNTIPCQLNTFEANRVAFISEKIQPVAWRHVRSADNPADIASRGCSPSQLADRPLWWDGPEWLLLPPDSWPTTHGEKTGIDELIASGTKREIQMSLVATQNGDVLAKLVSKYSKLSKLKRVLAWILRFVDNSNRTKENQILTTTLSCQEIEQGLLLAIKLCQKSHFAHEIASLKKDGSTSKSLKPLQPFLDGAGLLRVGGRLRNASLPFDQTHPLLLPKNDPLVNLIIDEHHLTHLHAGPRLLQSVISRKFWILAARSVIRSRLHKCVTCFRARPTNATPLMGDLPSSRVTPSRVFQETGVDFAGPFMLREHKRRNPKLTKCYLSLFVCMATKAVHLELVSELSAAAFLACFDRFVSRRGLCQTLHSDNGTNFTGAKRQLSEIFEVLLKEKNYVKDELASRCVEWKFIVPGSPWFGGLWESGIKSAKYHLHRIIGDRTLTFEEMSTIFCKIEAILNSRPLCSLSSDVAEINVLTPGHFLIGSPLVAVPEYDVTHIPVNQLDRGQLLQQITQQFWKVWSCDYLHTLVQRNKWYEHHENLKVGDVVIVSENNTAPTQWKTGIVEIIHPGRDNIVRAVTVRTTAGTFRRPAIKIFPLPLF